MQDFENSSLLEQSSAKGGFENIITPPVGTSFLTKLKTKWPIVLGVLGSIAVLAAIIFASYSYGRRGQEPQPTPTPILTIKPEITPSPIVESTPSSTLVQPSLVPTVTLSPVITYDLIFYSFPIGKPEEKTYWKVDMKGEGLQEYDGEIPVNKKLDLESKKYNFGTEFGQAINFPKGEGVIEVGIFAEDYRHLLIYTYDYDVTQKTVWSYDIVDGSTREIMKFKPEAGACQGIIGWSYSKHKIYAKGSELKGDWSGGPDYLTEVCVYNDKTGEKMRSVKLAQYQYSDYDYQIDVNQDLFVTSGSGPALDEGRTLLVNLKDDSTQEILNREYLLDTRWRLGFHSPLTYIVVRKIEPAQSETSEFRIYNISQGTFSKPIIFEQDSDANRPSPKEFSPDGRYVMFEHLFDKNNRTCWYIVDIDGNEKTQVLCEEQMSLVDMGSDFVDWIEK